MNVQSWRAELLTTDEADLVCLLGYAPVGILAVAR